MIRPSRGAANTPTSMPEVLPLTSLADAEPDLSTFENKSGLAEDMKFLASMPELCDVTFLVGETREPVCAVKVSARQREPLNDHWMLSRDSHASIVPFSGRAGIAVARISEAPVPGTVAAAQKGAAAAREQTAPVPQAFVGTVAELAECCPAGTRGQAGRQAYWRCNRVHVASVCMCVCVLYG